MMNGLKNRSECDWYTIKVKYAGLSAELKKEDDKILAILGELDDKYADITENSNVSVSSASEEQEMNSLYNESIPISEDDFIQRSASRISVKVEPEPEPTPEPQVTSVPVPVLSKVQPKRTTTMMRPKKETYIGQESGSVRQIQHWLQIWRQRFQCLHRIQESEQANLCRYDFVLPRDEEQRQEVAQRIFGERG